MNTIISLIISNLTVLRWATVLIILQAIYIILEVAFNARLVDSVSVVDSQYFEYLAHVGRVLSGVGCILVGFSLLRKWKVSSLRQRVAAHVLFAIIAFPLAYHGQEMIINALVDRSTAEQRAHAQYIALLKRGLVSNAVVFKGIEFAPEDVARPEAKTFISTIGFAVFFAPDFIQSVAENSDEILRHLAIKQSSQMLPDAYENYLKARDKVTELSGLYNEANINFEEKVKVVHPEATKIWREVYLGLERKWEQTRNDPGRIALKDAFDTLTDRLDIYFDARSRCTGFLTEPCVEKINREYYLAISSMFDIQVAPEYWCQPQTSQTNKVYRNNKFVELAHSGGLDCSSRNRDFIYTQFLELQDVSALHYESFEEFMVSVEVAREVRVRLAEQGIQMPENYRLRSPKSFINGVSSELTKEYVKAFEEEAKLQFGMVIPPRLTTESFIQHPVVQAPLKEALGLESAAPSVAINLSERDFHDQILSPQVEKKLIQERTLLLAQTAYFADGEPYAESGKNYVRSVILPPVAMGLSLFFGLLNLASLGAAQLSRLHLSASAIRALKLAFILLLVFGPLIFSSEIAQTESFQKIVDEAQASLGIGRYFVIWLTGLQPLIYPLGAGIANFFHLFG